MLKIKVIRPISPNRSPNRNPSTTYLIVVLIGILLFLVMGCSEEDTLVMPLESGDEYIYSGKYISRSGAGKPITLEAQKHYLLIEREFEYKGERRYLVTFNQGNIRVARRILTQNDQGIFFVQGIDKKTLIIPKHVKSGQKSKIQMGSREITIRIGGRKTFNTGIGKLEGREVSFSTTDRSRFKLWLNDKHGIIAIEYSYISSGSNRSEAKLVLEKFKSGKEDVLRENELNKQ